MEVRRFRTAGEFLDCSGGFLGEREAEHSLILGLSAQLERDPQTFGAHAYFAAVVDGRRVTGAALCTPPFQLLLSQIDDPATIDPIARDALDALGTLSGVLGQARAASSFAESWQDLTGWTARLIMSQRIYRADTAHVPLEVAGRMRPYIDRDRTLLVGWLDAFVWEALPSEVHREPPDGLLERRIADPDGGTALWVDGTPVSLAGFGGATPNGIRIGPVYTPPESRRRGYATALVAAMTRMLLEGGRAFCFLYTDLANPTSNSIYQRIGYRQAGEADQYVFENAPDREGSAREDAAEERPGGRQ